VARSVGRTDGRRGSPNAPEITTADSPRDGEAAMWVDVYYCPAPTSRFIEYLVPMARITLTSEA
jgi:hypothetical protein